MKYQNPKEIIWKSFASSRKFLVHGLHDRGAECMYVCMYLISLETLSLSAIRLVFMRGVYLAIYKYIKMKKKLINPQTQKEYYPEHNV
jgi:hypothetical protein